VKVALVSFFRNSGGGQAQRFLYQAALLRNHLKESWNTLRVVAVYGDCYDDTAAVLIDHGLRHNLSVSLVERSHGGPVFGSTEHPDRLRALTFVGNGGLEAVHPDDDVVVYVESDLIWESATISGLITRLSEPGVDVVAPLVFAGELFYDIFVYRKNGQRFSPFYPYHPELNHEGLTHVDSVGSCLVMRAEVARNCRMKDAGVLLSFCQDAWDKGYTVNVDATKIIRHPA
jgi:hypothetical protein